MDWLTEALLGDFLLERAGKGDKEEISVENYFISGNTIVCRGSYVSAGENGSNYVDFSEEHDILDLIVYISINAKKYG